MLLRLLLILVILFTGSVSISAQEPPQEPDDQITPEEAEQLMNSIAENMRQLEQMLAKASLAPEDLDMLMEQLKQTAKDKNFDHLPRTLREFLLNNPDLLAKLQNPDAEGDTLRAAEDEVRRLLATKDDGLEQLLRENPEILERLLSQEGAMQDALQEHSRLENDLQGLFDQTARQMESTEKDIQKLMELAQEMQQQMNQQAQNQQDQLKQERDRQEQLDRQRDNGVENPQGQDQNPEGSPGSESSGPRPDQNDPDGWDAFLRDITREGSVDLSREAVPQRYAAEAARYFRLLAEQARIERERQERLDRQRRDREGQ